MVNISGWHVRVWWRWVCAVCWRPTIDDDAGGWGAWVKGDTLTSGVYESRGCQQTTVGRLKYETEGERRGGGPLRQGCVWVSVRGRWDARARWEDVTMTWASLLSHLSMSQKTEFFFCLSFIGWMCSGRPRLHRTWWGMCAGQRWPVLEYSGRFMGLHRPEGRRSHAASVTRCREHIHTHRESDATHWIPACWCQVMCVEGHVVDKAGNKAWLMCVWWGI